MRQIIHIEILVSEIILLDYNPRIINDEDFKSLIEDIQHDPNFLIQRPPLVNKVDNKYYCYAGTQRVRACKVLGYSKIKCFIEADVPKILQNERMLKDNLHRGHWDEDKIMELGFEIQELEDIGLTDIDFDLLEEPTDLTVPTKGNPPTIKITFESDYQLKEFEDHLKLLIKNTSNYKNLKYSVSQGEL